MTGISGWSTTAATNATSQGATGGSNIAENCPPSGLNDAIRDIMGQLRATAIPLQVVSSETGAVATGTTVLPVDDTIPQNTEGDQYMSLAITPKSATSVLVIDVVVFASNSAGVRTSAAIFQDATAGALAAGVAPQAAANSISNIRFRHVMTSGTTSATTFKVRVGGPVAGTTTFNGEAGARLFGGVFASSITIAEYLQ